MLVPSASIKLCINTASTKLGVNTSQAEKGEGGRRKRHTPMHSPVTLYPSLAPAHCWYGPQLVGCTCVLPAPPQHPMKPEDYVQRLVNSRVQGVVPVVEDEWMVIVRCLFPDASALPVVVQVRSWEHPRPLLP